MATTAPKKPANQPIRINERQRARSMSPASRSKSASPEQSTIRRQLRSGSGMIVTNQDLATTSGAAEARGALYPSLTEAATGNIQGNDDIAIIEARENIQNAGRERLNYPFFYTHPSHHPRSRSPIAASVAHRQSLANTHTMQPNSPAEMRDVISPSSTASMQQAESPTNISIPPQAFEDRRDSDIQFRLRPPPEIIQSPAHVNNYGTRHSMARPIPTELRTERDRQYLDRQPSNQHRSKAFVSYNDMWNTRIGLQTNRTVQPIECHQPIILPVEQPYTKQPTITENQSQIAPILTKPENSTLISGPPQSHRWAMTSISDKLCNLEPFTGNILKITAETWIEQFELYADFKQLNDLEKLRLFKLLMHGAAASWLSALPAAEKTSMSSIFDAFKSRYGLSKVQMAKTERDIWLREQGPNESVDDFVSAVTNEAIRVKMTDEHLQRVLIQGFKPAIRMQVMSAGNCDTIPKMLLVARGCEAAQSGDRPSQSTANEQLSAMMTQLMAKVTSVAEDNKRLLAMSQYPSIPTTPTIIAPVAYAPQPYIQPQTYYAQSQPQIQPPQQYYAPTNMEIQPQEYLQKQRSYPNSNYHGNNFKKDYIHPAQVTRMAQQQTMNQQWTSADTNNQAINTGNQISGAPTQVQGTTLNQFRNQLCQFCGLEHPKGQQFCTAYGKTCEFCHLLNHTATVCFRRLNGQSTTNKR